MPQICHVKFTIRERVGETIYNKGETHVTPPLPMGGVGNLTFLGF